MGKKYSGQHKIIAVLHYLNSHDGYRIIARQFGVNRTLIQQWVRLYRLHGVEEVTVLFTQHKGCYGYHRITLLLRQMGMLVNKKRIQRLMVEQELRAVIRRRRRYSSYQGEQGRIAANVLARQFDSTQPNEKWVTDVTEFKVGKEKLYLSPLMDLYNREIVSYTLKRRPTYDLVNQMISQAFAQLPENASPLIHSD